VFLTDPGIRSENGGDSGSVAMIRVPLDMISSSLSALTGISGISGLICIMRIIAAIITIIRMHPIILVLSSTGFSPSWLCSLYLFMECGKFIFILLISAYILLAAYYH